MKSNKQQKDEIMSKKKTERLLVAMDKDMVEQIKQAAEKEDRSVSNFIRRSVSEAIKNQGVK